MGLGGRSVRYLKVDAQGYDLQVVRSAGKHMNRIRSVTVEAQCDRVDKIYPDAPNCSTVYKEMLNLGFRTGFNPRTCAWCIEVDIHFIRPGAQLIPEMDSWGNLHYTHLLGKR